MAATTPQEKQYLDQLFAKASKDDTGVLAGQDALPLLTASGLPQQTLGEVWALADPNNNGFLTKDNWYKVGRLIGWLQHSDASTPVDMSLASKPGPFPVFKGDYPSPLSAALPSLTMSPQVTGSTADGASRLPPLNRDDRLRFTRIFINCSPSNGLVAGDKARDVFLKSRLNYDKLGQIWNLADTQQRGSLDNTDFVIGMYLIHSCMSNPALSLPAALPPGLYEQASGGRPPPTNPMASHAGPGSPIQRQMTGQMHPQMTGQSISAATGAPSLSGAMSPSSRQATFPPPVTAAGVGAWDVTPEAKASSDQYFAQLDTQGKGVIEGDVAVPFMVQSQLDEAVLANIWDLSDIRQEGKLDRDEFAVAMHLINLKLAGKDIPASLPTSLIPPKSRSAQLPTQPPTASKDLFDLFNDSSDTGISAVPAPVFLPQPPSRRGTAQEPRRAPAPPPAAPQQQQQQQQQFFAGAAPRSIPGADLLGDDSQETQASPLPDASAEIGNKKNQLSNVTRSVSELEKSRGELEQSAASSSAQLEKLNTDLTAARAKLETETKAVSDLRIRVGEQTTQLKQLQGEVISAESDLNAMRMEKDELEQALLHDKEEVRGLQKRMKELGDEKTGLKLLLDKIKKEARQQKGMVSIAKKQLSTAESSRDSVQQEVRDAENATELGGSERALSPSLTSAAGVPLPHTPRALSPVATGNSQRSLNPFDRLQRNSASRPNTAASATGSHRSLSPDKSSGNFGGAVLAGAGLATGAAAVGAFAANRSSVDEEPHEQGFSQDSGVNSDGQDAFGAPTQASAIAPPAVNEDPFGAPPSQPASGGFESGGFGDSFAGPQSTNAHSFQEGAAPQAGTDFDSAFADFDDEEPKTSEDHEAFATPQGFGSLSPTIRPDSVGPTDAPGPANVAVQQPDVAPDFEAAALPSGISKPSMVDAIRPEAERTASTQAIPPSSDPVSPAADPTTLPSVGNTPLSETTAAPVAAREGGEESSDEDEGPEDLEAPGYSHTYFAGQAQTAEPVDTMGAHSADDHNAKARRSAPPPPSSRNTGLMHSPQAQDDSVDPFGSAPAPPVTDGPAVHADGHDDSTPRALPAADSNLDPFGAPAFGAVTAPTGGQQTSQFDDEDTFDFSDMPPAGGAPVQQGFAQAAPVVQQSPQAPPVPQAPQAPQVPQSQGSLPPAYAAGNQSSAFDDEFANFDDEFEMTPSQANSGSDNSNTLLQSYEVVPSQTAPHDGARSADAWGLNAGQGNPASNGAGVGGLSFDDAFGGDFEPSTTSAQQFSTPPIGGASPPIESGGNANANANARPALPQRPSTMDMPQADDLEDVKRLCGMGFPRSLVVGALDANGYDFQKALNVLLDK